MLLPPTALIAAEMVTLEACSLHGPHPRQRRRALAILGHHRAQSLPRVAALFAVRYATVHDWRRAWQQRGLAGLAEGRRAGRLPKLSEAAKKVTSWLGPATQQLRTLRPRIGRELGVCLSTSSLRRLARRLGYGWKRLRRSLKDRRDNVLSGFFQQELAALHRSERAGEVAVVYVDEGRVSRQAPVPYAWQVRGQAAVGRPAERGAGGYSVLGFWPPGAADPARAFVGRLSETAWTADLFVQAVDEHVGTLDQPTGLVLDNASIPRATCVRQRLRAWRTAGLPLQFLPAYSPELNRIEIRWRFLKHYWLTPPDYQSLDTLHQRLQFILKRIGSDYTVTFA